MARTLYLPFAIAYAAALVGAIALLWIIESVSRATPGPGLLPVAFVAAVIFAGTRYAEKATSKPSQTDLLVYSIVMTVIAFAVGAAAFVVAYAAAPDWAAVIAGEFGKVGGGLLLMFAAVVAVIYVVSARIFLGFAMANAGQR